MKQTGTLTHFLLICTLLAACHKSNLNYEKDFEKSHDTWLSFKQNNANSYVFQVLTSSWVGTSTQTIITVKAGKVTQRYFKRTLPPGAQVSFPPDQLEWTETESQINTHPNSGAAPLTLDEIYEKARTEWLVKRSNAKTYFEAKNDGMISDCGYVEDNCQDDCFRGITIGFIHSL